MKTTQDYLASFYCLKNINSPFLIPPRQLLLLLKRCGTLLGRRLGNGIMLLAKDSNAIWPSILSTREKKCCHISPPWIAQNFCPIGNRVSYATITLIRPPTFPIIPMRTHQPYCFSSTLWMITGKGNLLTIPATANHNTHFFTSKSESTFTISKK